ncbi:MAG: tetratricopeptide repeat protein, partial [Bdellovibrionales bacterium]|nr:tetratricopeptide repeat protein [Bdellovibrionales bacterium]
MMDANTTFQSGFEFLAPEYLLILPLAGFIALLGYHFMKKRRSIREQLGFRFVADLPLAFIAPAIIVFLSGVALSRPSIGTFSAELPQSTHSLFVAVDVSSSMLVKDVPPDRITLVRRKLLDLMDSLENHEVPVRVGILLFSGSSAMYCPLTADFNVLRLYIRDLSTTLLSSEGSDIKEALSKIILTTSQLNLARYSVAIISDGEFSKLPEDTSFPQAIYTFGVGTTDGGPIPLRAGGLQKDDGGNIVVSKLSEDTLRQLAQGSGGRYYRLGISDAPIESFVSHLSALSLADKESSVKQVTQKYEVSHYFVWLVLLFLAILYLIPLRAGVLMNLLIGTALLSGSPSRAFADSRAAIVGKEAYIAGDFEAAKKSLEEALRKAPTNEELKFALGSTLFRLGEFEKAEELLSEVASESKQGRRVFQSLYNAGNSALAAKKPKEAIAHYERALELLPDDLKTTHNLDLAKKLLEEQEERKQEQEQEQEEEEDQKDQNK